ncbi:MAG: hypothetical protein Q9224_007519, partial [Gallowayella concinna]
NDDAVTPSPTVRLWSRLPLVNSMPFRPHVTWSLVNADCEEVREIESPELSELRDPDYYEDQWSQEWLDSEESQHVMRPFRGLTILMRALAHSQTRVKSFSIRPQYSVGASVDSDGQYLGISHWYFRDWAPELHDMMTVFGFLRRLDLVLHAESEEVARKTLQEGHLRRLLNSAESLEELCLELRTMRVLDGLDPSQRYHKLRKLQIIHGIVDPDNLFRFLQTNQGSLRTLSLWCCESRTVTWDTLFTAVREQRVHVAGFNIYMLIDPDPGRPLTWLDNSICVQDESLVEDFFANNGPCPFAPYDARSGTPPPRFGHG